MGVIFCLSNQTGYSLLSIDETGKTALHYGARFGHKEIVKFIISSAPSPILDMVDEEKGKMIKQYTSFIEHLIIKYIIKYIIYNKILCSQIIVR